MSKITNDGLNQSGSAEVAYICQYIYQ